MQKTQTRRVQFKGPRPDSITTSKMIDTNWKKIFEAIQQIYSQNEGDLSYEELFRCSYTLVYNRLGDVLYSNTEACVKHRLDEILKVRQLLIFNFTTFY